MNLTEINIKLCELDNRFPPCGLWTDYYHVSNLKDIIYQPIMKKKVMVKVLK